MVKNILIVFILIIYTSDIYSQDKSNTAKIYDVKESLTKSEYVEDFNQLIDSIIFYHPNPYEFQEKEDFNRFIEKKKNLITDSTTVGEFVWLCRSVASTLGCGHTTTSIENILELSPSLFFPMEVRYINDRLYVINALSNEETIETGTEIISINGIHVKTLSEQIKAHINSDGYNSSLRELQLSSYFRAFCAFQLGFPQKYRIVFDTDHGSRSVVLTQSNDNSPNRNQLSNCSNNLCFKIDESKSFAVLTIRSFNYYEDDFSIFKEFIDSSFNQLEEHKLENLIIDLRNNYGGDPYCASYLLQHISDKAYRYYKKGSTNWYSDLEKMIPVNENGFEGKLYILINGGCFSTTGHIVSLIKANMEAVFIGQETGGTFSCNANNRSFTLENTGIFTSVATEVYQTDVTGFSKTEGIFPDHLIIYDLNDIINERDLEMEKAVNLISDK